MNLKLGEVCLLTNDVLRLADFYKALLGIDNGSNDTEHQVIIAEETMLTILNDSVEMSDKARNISIAFSCDDVNAEYERVKALGADIIEGPQVRPWGAVNMSFYDPDGNKVYLRSPDNSGSQGKET